VLITFLAQYQRTLKSGAARGASPISCWTKSRFEAREVGQELSSRPARRANRVLSPSVRTPRHRALDIRTFEILESSSSIPTPPPVHSPTPRAENASGIDEHPPSRNHVHGRTPCSTPNVAPRSSRCCLHSSPDHPHTQASCSERGSRSLCHSFPCGNATHTIITKTPALRPTLSRKSPSTTRVTCVID